MVDADLFDSVRDSIPSSLKIIGLPDTLERQMNCHGYAFNRGSWYETHKVGELLREGKLLKLKQAQINSIVLYIDLGREIPIVYHSAVYIGKGFVRSKWSNGPIFEHKVFDAPFSYGERIAFYKLTGNID